MTPHAHGAEPRTTTRRTAMNSPAQEPLRLAVISAGTSDPSSTRLLADRIADRSSDLAACHGRTVRSSVIELREISASTPIYKAGPSGLFTSFIDVLDDDLIIARPVVLAATAGTARHALAVDDQMRPMFAYLRALTIPTSLFAAPEDWGDPALNKRIDRAAVEFVMLMESGFAQQIKDASWESYQHEYGSAGGTETDIDLDTDMMRLAAGGSSA